MAITSGYKVMALYVSGLISEVIGYLLSNAISKEIFRGVGLFE